MEEQGLGGAAQATDDTSSPATGARWADLGCLAILVVLVVGLRAWQLDAYRSRLAGQHQLHPHRLATRARRLARGPPWIAAASGLSAHRPGPGGTSESLDPQRSAASLAAQCSTGQRPGQPAAGRADVLSRTRTVRSPRRLLGLCAVPVPAHQRQSHGRRSLGYAFSVVRLRRALAGVRGPAAQLADGFRTDRDVWRIGVLDAAGGCADRGRHRPGVAGYATKPALAPLVAKRLCEWCRTLHGGDGRHRALHDPHRRDHREEHAQPHDEPAAPGCRLGRPDTAPSFPERESVAIARHGCRLDFMGHLVYFGTVRLRHRIRQDKGLEGPSECEATFALPLGAQGPLRGVGQGILLRGLVAHPAGPVVVPRSLPTSAGRRGSFCCPACSLSACSISLPRKWATCPTATCS